MEAFGLLFLRQAFGLFFFEKQSRTMEDVVGQITVRDFEIADVRAQLRFELCRRQVTEGLLTKALQEIAFLERRLQSGEAGESSTKKARVEERPVEEKPTGSAAPAPPVKGPPLFPPPPPVQPPPQNPCPLASGLSSGRVFLEPEAPELKMKAPPVDDETAAEDAGGLPGPPTETMPRGTASKSAAPGDPAAAAAQEATAAAAEEAAAPKAAEAAAAAKAAEAAAAKAAEAAAAKAAEAAAAKAAEAAAAAAAAAAAKAADPAPAAAAKAADPAGAKAAVGRPPLWTAYGDVSGYLKTGKLALQFCSTT